MNGTVLYSWNEKMKLANTLIAAAIGTASMTVFSYIVSGKKKKDFREPALLRKMIYRNVPGLSKEQAIAAGWLVHFGSGLTFTIVYEKLLQRHV